MTARYWHPRASEPGFSYTFAGGYLEDPFDFDPLAFGISPREAVQMDPQQRILLEVVWEALEDAGIAPGCLAGEAVGVYVGASNVDYQSAVSVDHAAIESHFVTGIALSIVSNRISHVLDLNGPSMTIDTACSSSIVALAQAHEAIESGRIDTAIVAGVNLLLSPAPYIGFSRARMLSPTGLCRPFSAEADGYVRSEGAVALVLRRLDAAKADRNRIRSVLLGAGVNSDGRTPGISLPSLKGQKSLLTDVYRRSEIDPEALAFVEAHGTGTPVGDPIEARAIGEALGHARSHPLPIGSVKSNVGHLECASGLTGLAKVVLSLERGIYPRTIHVERTNPAILLEELNLEIVREDLKLDNAIPLVAGVCNYGFGGTNAHAILRAPDAAEADPAEDKDAETARALVISAQSEAALRALALGYAETASSEPSLDVSELASAASARRGLLAHRAVVPLRAREGLVSDLEAIAAGKQPAGTSVSVASGDHERIAFVFPGNGCQWVGMGRSALLRSPDFAREMDEIDAVIRDRAGWSAREALLAADLEERLASTSVAVMLVFAIQTSLRAVMARRGVVPACVIGHSVGEVAAAEASGALDREQAVALILERSLHQEKIRGLGGMVAASVDETRAQALATEVGGGVEIAAINSPNSITFSGPEEALRSLRATARRRRIATIRLAVDYPFHSALLDAIRDDLLSGLRDFAPAPSRVPMISTVTGAEISGELLDAEYWWHNVRKPVRFRQAVESALAAGARCFLELSPRPLLLGATNETARSLDIDAAALHTLSEADDGLEVDPMVATFARMVANGAHAPGPDLVGSSLGWRVPLPHYPWQRQTCLVAPTSERIDLFGSLTGGARHPLAGTRIAANSPEWRAVLDPVIVPFLRDHKVGDEIVVPGAGLVEIALAVGRDLFGDGPLEIEDFDIAKAMVLGQEDMREISVRFEHHVSRVEIWSRTRFGEEWLFHAGCRIARAVGEPSPALPLPDPNLARSDDAEQIYRAAFRAGLVYGPEFRRAVSVLRDDTVLSTTLAPGRADTGAFEHAFVLDPTALDAALHGIFAARPAKGTVTIAHLPVRVRRLRVWLPQASIVHATAHIRRETDRGMSLDLRFEDAAGSCVAEVQGLYLRAVALSWEQEDERQLACEVERIAVSGQEEQARSLPEHTGSVVPAQWLLTRAAIVAIAHAALYSLSCEGVLREAALSVEADDRASALMRALVALLENDGSAEPITEGWRLAPETGYAAPDDLIATLIDRFPAAQAELLLLLELRCRLPQALEAGLPSLSEQTRTLILGEASAFALAIEALDREIEAAKVIAAGRRPRVLALLPCIGAVLERLTRAHIAREIELVVLSTERTGPTSGLPGDVRIYGSDACGPTLRLCDLLVKASFGADEELPESAFALSAPRCRAAILAFPPRDVFEVFLALVSEGGARGAADGIGRLTEAARVEAVLRRRGFMPETTAQSLSPTFVVGERLLDAGRAKAPRLTFIHRDLADVDAGLVDRLQAADGVDAETTVLIDLPGASRDDDSIPNALRSRALRLAEVFRNRALEPEGVRICVITRGAHDNGGLPCAGADAIWSFVRVAINEYPALDIRLVDLAPDLTHAEAADALLRFLSEPGDEREVMIDRGGLSAPRVSRGVRIEPCPGPDLRAVLETDAGASLDDFAWRWRPRTHPGPDEIEVEVEATGLNFRDVMVALGVLDDDILGAGSTAGALGFECAGRVLRVGDDVDDLEQGDLVMGFVADAFASHITAPRRNFVRAPANLSAEEAATCPVVFATAWFALVEVGRLRSGDVVLVHGGAGGVGMAAIQIAKSFGARVLATAATPERRHLAALLGADAVYESRSLEFADRIRADHGGVDLVLNSLSGEGMRASLRLLRPFGRFVELGKRDYLENTALELRPFVHNLAYFGVDLDELLAHDSGAVARVLTEVRSRLESGAFTPLPFRSFPGERVADAFRLLQRSGHVGKVLVRPPSLALPPAPTPSFVPRSGVHVVVGGTGGLGLETAIWLAELGAEHVVIASRRGVLAEEDRARIDPVSDRIVVERVDAADPKSVSDLMMRIRAIYGEIAGVVHTAMVLEDGLLEGLDEQCLERVLAPKVDGVRALDAAVRADKLQYFVVYSSAATLIGNPGQGAYVLANAYLEGFVRERRARGEPGLAIGWGAISDVGVVARDRELAERIARTTGVTGIPARDALAFLGKLLARGADTSAVAIFSAVGRSAVGDSLTLLSSPAFAALAPSGRAGETTGADLAVALAGKSDTQAREIVVATMIGEIARILRVPEDGISPNRPLAEIGMDSLMALELRLGLEERLGIELPLLSLGEKSTLDVADKVLAGLRGVSADVGLAMRVEALADIHGGETLDSGSVAALSSDFGGAGNV